MNSGKHPWLTGLFAGALFLLLPLTGAWGTTPVSNLVLRAQEGFTELLVPGAARLLCDHSSQEPSDKHPFRIVLDFCDANHALGQQTFDALPATIISRIRTSQFAESPQRIVRVVLDLRKSATYTVNAQQNDLLLRVVDPDRATFAAWEANRGSTKALASTTTSATASKPVVPAAATAKAETPAATRQTLAAAPAPSKTTSTAKSASPATAAVVKTEQPKPVTQPATQTSTGSPRTAAVTSETIKPAAKPEPVVAAAPSPVKKQVSTSTPQTPVKTPVVETAKTPTEFVGTASTQPVAKTEPAAKPSTRDDAYDAFSFNQTQPLTQAPPSKPADATPYEPKTSTAVTDPVPVTPVYVVPKRPLVFAPEILFGEEQPTTADNSGETDKVPVAQVSMTPIGPKTPPTEGGTGTTSSKEETGTSPELASTTTLPLATRSKTAAKPGDTLAANSQETLFERLRTKFFSEQTPPRPYTSIDLPVTGAVIGDSGTVETYGPPTPPTMLSREELLERVRQAAASAGLSGSPADGTGELAAAAGFAARQNVIYDDMGRRDPFAPLVKGLHSGFVSDQLPSVENLRLVGVLRDDREAIALFENQEGYGYVLRVGDRVENGTVAAIEENRVLFRVQDFGWTHVVALQLTSRGADPSKSLGAKTPLQLEYPDANQSQETKPIPNSNQTPKPEGDNP